MTNEVNEKYATMGVNEMLAALDSGEPVPTEYRVRLLSKLRGGVKTMEQKHKAAISPLKDALERVENNIMALAAEQGTTGFTTPFGRVSVVTSNNFRVVNRAAVDKFIMDNDRADLLQGRVVKSVVEDVVGQRFGQPIPGIETFARQTVRLTAAKGDKSSVVE